MGAWLSIDNAPKDGEPVDLWVSCFDPKWRPEGDEFRIVDAWWDGGRWMHWTTAAERTSVEDEHYRATHWIRVGEPERAKMNDILEQMVVTAANGERIMFFDIRAKAEEDGRREEYEAARMDNLMKLGVTQHEIGPMLVTGSDVRLVQSERAGKPRLQPDDEQ